MRNIKKRILSVVVVIGITLGITCVPAHAEWQKGTNGWNYYENGSLKTGWLQDNGNWYFFNKKGNMLTGWITDKGTWYYMREDGSLNNSKTTLTIPSEIQSIINIVSPFSDGLKLKYAGRLLTPWSNSVFTKYDLDNKKLIAFSSEDNYGNKTNYYLYDPYYCRVFVLYSDFTIELLGTGNENHMISSKQAEQMMQIYLEENQINIPNLTLNIYDEKNNSYFILCQEINVDHVNTVVAYYIDKTTGLIIPRD